VATVRLSSAHRSQRTARRRRSSIAESSREVPRFGPLGLGVTRNALGYHHEPEVPAWSLLVRLATRLEDGAARPITTTGRSHPSRPGTGIDVERSMTTLRALAPRTADRRALLHRFYVVVVRRAGQGRGPIDGLWSAALWGAAPGQRAEPVRPRQRRPGSGGRGVAPHGQDLGYGRRPLPAVHACAFHRATSASRHAWEQ
jgi:hypothetical protein